MKISIDKLSSIIEEYVTQIARIEDSNQARFENKEMPEKQFVESKIYFRGQRVAIQEILNRIHNKKSSL